MKDWNETYISFLTADTRKDGKQREREVEVVVVEGGTVTT